MPRFAFIGAGNISRSLIDGLMAGGLDVSTFGVSDPDAGQLAKLTGRYPGLATSITNRDVIEDCDVAVLCVKPDSVHTVCRETAGALARRKALLISAAAGVPLALLDRWTGARLAIIRCMPNTPVAVGRGVAALCAGARVSRPQRETAEQLLGAAAVTVWITDEKHMNLITALSGSGPAYFFRVVQAFENAAVRLGLETDTARRITIGTFCGAAALADVAGDVAGGIHQVTSKGGTTERGLAELEQAGLEQLAEKVLTAAATRAAEITAHLTTETHE